MRGASAVFLKGAGDEGLSEDKSIKSYDYPLTGLPHVVLLVRGLWSGARGAEG